MALDPKRAGEIALLHLTQQFEREGFNLTPEKLKRELKNQAKKLGITPGEMAGFARIFVENDYAKKIAILNEIEKSGEE